MMATDTTEKGLEALIVAAMTGKSGHDAPTGGEVRDPPASYISPGYVEGDPDDYDREHAVDLAKYRGSAAGTEQLTPLDSAKNELFTLRRLETEYIDWVIKRCEGNKTKAAEILGIDVSTIHRRGKTGSKRGT